MSLINDALKKAGQNPPPASPAPGAPMVAVPETSAPSRGSGRWIMPVVVVGLVVASGFFFWKWQQGGQSANPTVPIQNVAAETPVAPAASATAPVATPVEAAPVVAAQAPVEAPRLDPISQAIAAGPVQVGTPVAKAPAPAADPVVPPVVTEAAPVEVKLQAIFFRLKNPTAILNGRTLEIGESFQGVRLLEIQRSHVVVERAGRRETLELR